MMQEPEQLWTDEDEQEFAIYRYAHGLMDAAERAAFEAWAAARPEALARLGAWARARRATRYLRMRIVYGAPRPETPP
jgi:hypothetical protein